jgi:hypothetical protein
MGEAYTVNVEKRNACRLLGKLEGERETTKKTKT